MNIFTIEQTPAQIVKKFPKASDLFKKNQIDFCCGGNRPLSEAIEEQALDQDTILAELNNLYEDWNKEEHTVIDWDAMSASDLIDYITSKYHADLKDELPALSSYVTRVFNVHGEGNPHLKELYQLFHEFKDEIEEHTIKEDNEIYPLIKQYEQHPNEELLKQIHEANGTLESEHDKSGELLKQMRAITNDFTPPAGACNTYQMTYARLKELVSETFDHIHLENNVLFHKF